MQLAEVDFCSYQTSIEKALDLIDAGKILAKQKAILLKPNLINASPHPITTPVQCIRAIIDYVRSHSKAEIIVAEGCGDSTLETDEIFNILGYRELTEQYGIQLVDLNNEDCVELENHECSFFPKMVLPKIAFSHYIISVPVLKAHSLAKITGTLKNMMGFAPPAHYAGRYGSWKKSVFHEEMHLSIFELNRYRTPDLTLMDATIGMADYHLGGNHCSPPINKIIAGYDPVELDRKAALYLNIHWEDIPHLDARHC